MIDLLHISDAGSPVFAQAPGGPGGNPMTLVGMAVIFMAIMYFMLIRPQQRREKERQAMLSSLKKGQRVVFGGGILGQIVGVKDEENIFLVRIADNVKIEVSKGAVSGVVEKGEPVADEAAPAGR